MDAGDERGWSLAVVMHSRQSREARIKQVQPPRDSSLDTIVAYEMFVIRQTFVQIKLNARYPNCYDVMPWR